MGVEQPRERTPQPLPPPLPTWKKLLFSLSLLLFVLGIIEVALRIRYHDSLAKHEDKRYLFVRSENARLVYEMRPSHEALYPGTEIQVRTNAAGFRDREFEPKPPGRFRIAAVGDSVTVGWEVQSDETYPKRLEQLLLTRTGANLDLFNMGVGGYNSLQEFELIRTKVLAYEPDLILLGYVLNDGVLWGHDGGATRYFLHSGCMLWDQIRLRWARLRYRIGEDLVSVAFRDLAQLARDYRVPVLVVVFPYLDSGGESGYPHQAAHDHVAALAKQHGFGLLDLLETFRKAGLDTFRARPDDIIHPNKAGHSLAAEAIAAHLAAQGLVPLPGGESPAVPR